MRIAVLLVVAALGAGLCCDAHAAAAKHQRAEDQQKRQDDPKNWPARDFASATAVPAAICVLIKDPKLKTNQEAEQLTGKDLLGNDEVRAKLRGFTRLKVKSDGSDGKGWPAAWLSQARGGAVLVLFSSNQAKVTIIDKTHSKETLLKAADAILKYVAQWKETAAAQEKEARAKQEASKPPPPVDKPDVPGLDGKIARKDKKKPGSKEPQDE